MNLTIPELSLIVLIGPSGSGKTTLLKILSMLERPDAGTVLIDGEEYTSKSNQRSPWPKLTAVLETASHLFLSAHVSKGPSQDSPQFRPVRHTDDSGVRQPFRNQLHQHVLARGIERRSGLIHHHDGRLVDQHAGNDEPVAPMACVRLPIVPTWHAEVDGVRENGMVPRGVAQSGSARGLGPRGRPFESGHPDSEGASVSACS